jgi:hypothetical protein
MAALVDPRDVSVEYQDPIYRVYFFDSHGASQEWRLSDVPSVSDALSWAREHAAGRTYVLYLEVELGPGTTALARLLGDDPNSA